MCFSELWPEIDLNRFCENSELIMRLNMLSLITISRRKEVYDITYRYFDYLILSGVGCVIILEHSGHSMRIVTDDLFNTWKFQQRSYFKFKKV